MTFSSEIKTELCKITEKNSCCRRSELAAMLLFGGNAAPDSITVRTERDDVFKRMCILIRKELGLDDRRTPPEITLPMAQLSELGIFSDQGDMAIDEEVFDKSCCKRSFFRGAFLAAGTASDPRKTYRLELFAYNETVAALASEILESFGLSPKSTRRKNYFIIYLEDYESVCDALIIMGAQRSMLKMSYIQIEKDFSNRNNRRNNCYIANVDKAVTVSARQCAAIDRLAAAGALENLDPNLKTVAYARAQNPEMSLKELSEITGISKSTLSRRLNKLESLSMTIDN